MRYCRLFVVALLTATLLAAGPACQTDGGSAKPDETTEQTDERPPPLELAETFDLAARFLPADARMVVVASNHGFDQALAHFFPEPGPSNRQKADGQDGTVAGLSEDLSALFRRRLGFDPTSARAAVFAAGKQSTGAVFVGELTLTDDAEMVTIAGKDCRKIPIADSVARNSGLSGPLWAVSVDEPRKATAIFLSRDALETRLERPAGTTPDGLQPYRNVAKSLGSAHLFVGSGGGAGTPVDEAWEDSPLTGDAPRAAGMAVGRRLSVAFAGKTETLDAIASFVDEQRDRGRDKLHTLYERAPAQPASEAASTLLAYHLGIAYLEAVESTRQTQTGTLRYRTPLPAGARPHEFTGMLNATVPLLYLTINQSMETAQMKNARIALDQLNQIIETHYMIHDELPEELDDLAEGQDPFLRDKDDLLDPWGNRFIYEKTGEQDYELFSPGPDGEAGTEDDLRYRPD